MLRTLQIIADYNLRKKADGVIECVENFRMKNKRLPHSLSELDIFVDESGPIYYLKVDSTGYLVWFGACLGESVVYSSSIKSWR
jgi:hypothetical protein